MDELDKIRNEINLVDERILEALANRRKLAQRIIRAKDQLGTPIRDALREEQLLDDLIAKGRSQGLDAHLVTRVFHEIIDDSIRSQQLHLLDYGKSDLKRVAFQGIEGAYSEIAGRKYFSPYLDHTLFVGVSTLEQVVNTIEDGDAEYGLLPVENTTAGSINEVYDLLSCAQLSIVGEEVLRVEHCLLGMDEEPLANIRQIYSHPQALVECMKFVSKLPHCQAVPYADSAMAVKKVKEEGDPSIAAIGSEEAGRLYGLKVLRRNIEDQQNNYTRFLILAKKPASIDLRIPCKTSLIMATSHEEGSLLKALSLLHEYKINLSKLESRPIPGNTSSISISKGMWLIPRWRKHLKDCAPPRLPSKFSGRIPRNIVPGLLPGLKSLPAVRLRQKVSQANRRRKCRKRSAIDWPAANTRPMTRSSW
jgi:chorismate mutase/prephenate dehydratase